jgi:hypothetical protein
VMPQIERRERERERGEKRAQRGGPERRMLRIKV